MVQRSERSSRTEGSRRSMGNEQDVLGTAHKLMCEAAVDPKFGQKFSTA
jgi:hypothetical protein